MKCLLKSVMYVILGIIVFWIGFFGAYTINTIYDNFKVFREHQEQVDNLIVDLSDSKQTIYNLMEKVTILKYKQSKPTYEDLKSSTVYIVQQKNCSSMKYNGTGVIVKQSYADTYILTNKHVCNEKNKEECFIEIFKHGGLLKIPLTFIKQEKTNYDLSLWKTSEILPDKKPIKGLKEAFIQDEVYSVGNYLGYRYIYTEGTFAGYRGNHIIVNMPCVYGCSGSAVFNKDGYLIGLVYAGNGINHHQVDTSKALLVPYEIIKVFLKDIL